MGQQLKWSVGLAMTASVFVASLPARADEALSHMARPLSAIRELEQVGPVDVQVSIGTTPSMMVSAAEEVMSHIHTEQQGDRLRIWTEGVIITNKPMRIDIVTPSLEAIHNQGSGDVWVRGLAGSPMQVDGNGSGSVHLSGETANLSGHLHGSGNLEADQLRTHHVDLELLGSGDVALGAVEADSVKVMLHGSGNIKAAGHTKTLVGAVLGSGDLEMIGLRADDADLTLNGSGDITANASQSVRVRSSGSGDVVVHGNPLRSDVVGKGVRVGA